MSLAQAIRDATPETLTDLETEERLTRAAIADAKRLLETLNQAKSLVRMRLGLPGWPENRDVIDNRERVYSVPAIIDGEPAIANATMPRAARPTERTYCLPEQPEWAKANTIQSDATTVVPTIEADKKPLPPIGAKKKEPRPVTEASYLRDNQRVIAIEFAANKFKRIHFREIVARLRLSEPSAKAALVMPYFDVFEDIYEITEEGKKALLD